MQTKIILIIDNLANPKAFEQQAPALLALAKDLPELLRVESAQVWPKEDGTPTPAHRTLDLYFSDYASAARAVATPEAGAFFEALTAAGGTFTGLFAKIETP
ncbi:EthD family reductase [Pseudarthrobacter sp. L1SW]|uniref:EthD family reductase n=1 Tax=Pseudarthrobacter sp. L1SW TaxID=2851598 RepID=UPI001E4E766D|nr:EthD family reductase [Pseudarthrobacter sp. L1SW]UEL30093.1 EthD family reductase [Pseudarthrobacter sp. L1SW]